MNMNISITRLTAVATAVTALAATTVRRSTTPEGGAASLLLLEGLHVDTGRTRGLRVVNGLPLVGIGRLLTTTGLPLAKRGLVVGPSLDLGMIVMILVKGMIGLTVCPLSLSALSGLMRPRVSLQLHIPLPIIL